MKLLTIIVCFFGLANIDIAIRPVAATEKDAKQIIQLRTDLQTEFNESLNATDRQQLQTVQCILGHIGWKAEITSSPVMRNRILTRNNEIDGFFLHSPRLLPHALAYTSQPLAIERWYMFQRKGNDKKISAGKQSVGAVLGSNEHRWLEQRNFENIITAPSLTSVVKMLHRDRVAYALSDRARFWKNVFLTETPAHQLDAYFVRYAPLVMYFSADFIARNPDFLDRFNRNIDQCVKDRLKPTSEEVSLLRTILQEILTTDDHQATLLALTQNALKNRPRSINPQQEDTRWIKAQKTGTSSPLMDAIEDNPLSDFLRGLTRLGASKINELFIMDKAGYIIGMNQTTSDYWQGDEAAYEAIMIKQLPLHISEIAFDASTQKFQIQITLPLKDPLTGSVIALMVTGFDADIALTSASDF